MYYLYLCICSSARESGKYEKDLTILCWTIGCAGRGVFVTPASGAVIRAWGGIIADAGIVWNGCDGTTCVTAGVVTGVAGATATVGLWFC